VYISRDVVFDEDIFPFSKLHPNAGARLRSEILLLPSNLLNPSDGDELVDDSVSNDANPTVFGARNIDLQAQQGETGAGAAIGVDLLQIPCASSSASVPIIGAGESGAAAAPPPSSGAAACPGSASAPTAPGAGSPPRQPEPATSPVLVHPGETSAPAPATGTAAPAPVTGPAAAPTPATGSSVPGASGVSTPESRPRTRLQAGIRKPKVYTDGTIRYGLSTFTDAPRTVEEALGSKHWKEAMDIEYNALLKNNTWHLVPPKKGSNIIDCKWVFKVKLKADGTLDKYKARLVAKGFKQRFGID
jgi:hypothetical protein